MKENIYSCNLDAETGAKLNLYLYKEVKNLKELREKVMNGSLKCCIIKPSLVCSPFQVSVAANKALLSAKRGTMTTRTIFSEVLFNLSLSKNITQSLIKFGIDDKETNLLVAIIEQDGEDTSEILGNIDGVQCSIDDLEKFSDTKLIEKAYKVQNCKQISQLTDLVVSKIVTKDFISH